MSAVSDVLPCGLFPAASLVYAVDTAPHGPVAVAWARGAA